uniref:methenyltetrahydrofolate cyclohydrolase n=1 Tax=Anopheles atroparvus TaxID=41427 RepID=A0AAG5DF07_ANOAO
MVVQCLLSLKPACFAVRYKVIVTQVTRTKTMFTSEIANATYHIFKIDRPHTAPLSVRSTLVGYSSNRNGPNTNFHRPLRSNFQLRSANVPSWLVYRLNFFCTREFLKIHKMVQAKDSQVDKSLTAPESTSNIRMLHSSTQVKDSLGKMAKLIDGKQIASEIRAELREQIVLWKTQGHRAPQLTAILIGDDPASATYVNNKMKAAEDVGINSKTERYSANITEEELISRIQQLNEDEEVDGILVQLPVPGHINERKVCNTVSCDKDVDGFNERNVGRLCLDMNTLIPCTPLGVQELIKRAEIETFGKNAVVVGRSKNVGMPIAMLLHADGRNDTCAMDATVTICHRFTPLEELKRFCRSADIIVTATGVPGLITADMVKEGAAVIDVGITRVNDPVTGKTKLVGDVDFEGVRKVAGSITPVPGGVGPMTVAMLMKNTVVAAKNLVGKRNAH